MAFEGLTEKLSNAFKKLRGKGRLSESDVKESMREIRLALMGASGSVFALEDVRIRKQARGAANRAINCDEHNSEKMLNAAQQQVSAIRWYTIAHGLRELPPALQEIARLRLENVDLSLTELGAQLDPPLSKSAVNHRMRRLMLLIQQAEEADRKEAAEQKPDK